MKTGRLVGEAFAPEVGGGWGMVKNMATIRLTRRFSSNRVVREYTEQRYLPAAWAYR